jgi:hypothetical protein
MVAPTIACIARGEPFDSLALSLSKGELAQDRPGRPRAFSGSSFDKLRTSVCVNSCAV